MMTHKLWLTTRQRRSAEIVSRHSRVSRYITMSTSLDDPYVCGTIIGNLWILPDNSNRVSYRISVTRFEKNMSEQEEEGRFKKGDKIKGKLGPRLDWPFPLFHAIFRFLFLQYPILKTISSFSKLFFSKFKFHAHIRTFQINPDYSHPIPIRFSISSKMKRI